MPAPQPPKRCLNQPPSAIPAMLSTLQSSFQLTSPWLSSPFSGIRFTCFSFPFPFFPQLLAPDYSGHCRTQLRPADLGPDPTASCRSQGALRVGTPSRGCGVALDPNTCQKDCQRECQTECQRQCQIKCKMPESARVSEDMPDRVPERVSKEMPDSMQEKCQI